MNVKITNANTSFQLDVKRFYFDSELEVDCPTCNEHCVKDFTQDYLSYPSVNEPMNVGVVCKNDHEFEVPVRLRVTLL